MKHPVRGQAQWTPSGSKQGRRLIRHHHERYDGKGFPDKIKGRYPPCRQNHHHHRFCGQKCPQISGRYRVGRAITHIKTASDKAIRTPSSSLVRGAGADVLSEPASQADVVELELNLRDLSEGMVLSRGMTAAPAFFLLE